MNLVELIKEDNKETIVTIPNNVELSNKWLNIKLSNERGDIFGELKLNSSVAEDVDMIEKIIRSLSAECDVRMNRGRIAKFNTDINEYEVL